MAVVLVADSGATKAEWCLMDGSEKKTFYTQGISPYFLSNGQIAGLLQTELLPQLHEAEPDKIFYYGTGCANADNAASVTKALEQVFFNCKKVEVQTDLTGAARGLFGDSQGIACILGTGCNSGYYNGNKIAKNSPGLGYVLGDEGSGAYLGRKVLQYYLYNTFDEELKEKFDAAYNLTAAQILDKVYKGPFPNRYLASFTLFLAQNRGHYMIENILEDGLNDFFFQHLCKFGEVWKLPVGFVGSVALGFEDVLLQLCASYEFEPGPVLKAPMAGLVQYHEGSV